MISCSSPNSAISLPSRYDMLFPLASGGTASVHLGRLRGIAGFWRLVAFKVGHEHLHGDPMCRDMMVEEARLASKIHHPNVVPVIDIADAGGRLLLVMEYIEGASLADLIAEGPIPPRVAVRILLDACAGLHAAHNLRDAEGRSLNLVHRDVSPQNILVGTDGVARLTDFGVAKTAFAKGRSAAGTLKGKLGYMAPEYILGSPANARSDLFGLAIVAWEVLAGRRLFRGRGGHETLCNVLKVEAPPLSAVAPHLGGHLDAVLAAALSKRPEGRHGSVHELGAALEAAATRAGLAGTAEDVRAFVLARVGERLAERRQRIAAVVTASAPENDEPSSSVSPSVSSPPAVEGGGARRAPVEAPVSASPPIGFASPPIGFASPPTGFASPPTGFASPPPAPSRTSSPDEETTREGKGLREAPHVIDDEPTVPSPGMEPTREVSRLRAAAPPGSQWNSGRTLRVVALLVSFALGGLAKLVFFPEASSATVRPPAPASPSGD